ncbi:hypothetical protein DFH07DRAFT_767685 [Mycena maculata]|uniref:Uncharacterized protein n=1 Tax=Mycena maculata TaxID=230809 RepID=A0AAD7NSV9_9AGAR|nr:hypothetical protein DFH07DRAFT_767685 [Mycena maculata]
MCLEFSLPSHNLLLGSSHAQHCAKSHESPIESRFNIPDAESVRQCVAFSTFPLHPPPLVFPPQQMSPLIPAQITDLLHSCNRLTTDLTLTQLEEVAHRMGLSMLAHNLLPLFLKIMLAAQRITCDTPPEYDDQIDNLIRNFDVSLLVGILGASVRKVKKGSRRRKPPAGTFIIFYDGEVGVFERWEDVQASITGHVLAIYCGFPDILAANNALEYAHSKGWTADSQPPPTAASPFPVPSTEPNPLSTGALATGLCLNILGLRGAIFNAFTTHKEAEEVFKDTQLCHLVRSITHVQSI